MDPGGQIWLRSFTKLEGISTITIITNNEEQGRSVTPRDLENGGTRIVEKKPGKES